MPRVMNNSRLELILKNWIETIRGWPPRQRLLALILAVILLLTVIFFGIIEPLLDLEDQWAKELQRKHQLLTQYKTLMESREKIVSLHQSVKSALAQAEGQFLTGANPAVAASDLQEILKNLTKAQGVQVVSTKILSLKEHGPYQEVPVLMQLVGNIEQILTLLYNLEFNQKVLLVTELEINAPQREVKKQESPQLRANLVVAGLIKKGQGI
jgi:type II secretory pathway component PulM